MKTVRVSASKSYDVLIASGLLPESGRLIRSATGAGRALVVSGDIVWPLYGERLKSSLEAAGIDSLNFVLPHGEQAKNLENYGRILDFLSRNHMSRGDVLIALGGGVTGDISGFAAATYQRGMEFVQIPTTLLSAVDSSVGGKTAVNLPTGKNQVGSFYQPSLVICDPELLSSLPDAEFACGCAEVIKYAMLGSPEFFEQLEALPVRSRLEDVICRCVEMKRDIVAQDEFDRGLRQLLNLGHSVGHAVEACSGFSLLHGQAVSIGMAVITRAAVEMGFCPRNSLDRLLSLLRACGLPTETEYTLEQLYSAALSDKKLSGGSICLVVPEDIGRCRLLRLPAPEIKDWLRAGGIKE